MASPCLFLVVEVIKVFDFDHDTMTMSAVACSTEMSVDGVEESVVHIFCKGSAYRESNSEYQ